MTDSIISQFIAQNQKGESLKILDQSPENIALAIDYLTGALNLMQTFAREEAFHKTSIYLKDKDPELDIRAIAQLFSEAQSLLASPEKTKGGDRVWQTLSEKVDALSKRLDSSDSVYREIPTLAAEDFKKRVTSLLIQNGLNQEEEIRALEKSREGLLTLAQVYSGVTNTSYFMSKAFIILKTSLTSLKWM